MTNFQYDDVTDISASAEDISSVDFPDTDTVIRRSSAEGQKGGYNHTPDKSVKPSQVRTDKMEATTDSHNDDNDIKLFPNHGFSEENLEDDLPAIDEDEGGTGTDEVIDDVLTLTGGDDVEEEEEDDEGGGEAGASPVVPLHIPPPHLALGPVGSSGGHSGFSEEGTTATEDDANERRSSGLPPQPLPLPRMDTPGGDDDDEDDDEDLQMPPPEGSYDPADYENLDVSPELKELLNFISRYTPQNIELEYRLRPFIPDYIPAVGDIDAFIKIQRPDGENSTLGLTVLDEPSARQSDSTVLDLQLRAVAKQTTARSVVVKTVENAEKNGKVIEKWMRDISDLHRAKPPPTVHYSKRMPDIDTLMQEWPGEVEELFREINLPTAALQVELPQYVDLICGILDIPVYKSRIQSLHVLFTLYSAFKNSANFRHLANENIMENEPTADRLVL